MAKSPKLDLFEKLSELKAWQSKQQEKLLTQQKEQQSILKRQQRQEMDLFDSRKTEFIEPQNCSVNMRGLLNDRIWRDRDMTALRCEDSGRTEEDIDTVNKPGNVSLENMPVKSAIVDFEKLLERKLKEIGSNVHEGKEQINNVKPKRQFLRKGEGLKRFNMKSHNEFTKNKPANTNIEPQIRKRIPNATIQNRNTANGRTSNSKSKEEVMPDKDTGLNPQPLPKYTQSATWSSVLNQEGQGCSTKLDRMCKHEAEDLKVFELLEQMAVDSSFCSTSSTLLGFMESPVISTPLKAILEHRKQQKDLKSPKQLPFGMDLSDEETEDFATSSESCSSENETVEGKVNDAQGSSRVRFCNLVEEREFDAGIENLTQKSSLNAEDDFEDTEVWSDSDGKSDESTSLTVSNKPTAVEKQEESRTFPLSEKDIPSCSTPGMTSNEDGSRNDSSKIILKSELLHRKLLELEKEIETFRKENELLFRKKQLQQQAEEKWLKEKNEIEKRLKEKEEELKNKALDERQKLSREKRVFETYSKKMSEKASNHQEVEILQKKLTELQLELREKERKNTASYNRISNRVKVLEKENSELKEEIEKWKKEKQMESRKSTSRLIGSRKSVGNTKALHRINDELTRVPPVAKEASKSKYSVKIDPLKASEERMKSEDAEMESGVSLRRIRQKSYSEEDEGDRRPELKEISDKNEEASTERADSIPQISGETDCQIMGRQSSAEAASHVPRTPSTFLSEKLNSDGSREIRYENGNFKKISPDGLNIKLFYFNGDVKESLSDGTIKYYYSESRTWHTTFPDGLEILEFPNGQVERHFQGTVEVAFPDGTVRIIQGDGREELRLPDGTNVVTDTNGDKIISFPNGQKEYQTNDFKKRVYPDGTMKIVYSDGVQETRYSNGRVRLRDAAGSLLMDSES